MHDQRLNRRGFLGAAALSATPPTRGYGCLTGRKGPQINFYGATQQVDGSCRILECSEVQFVVDADRNPIEDQDKDNGECPFEQKDLKALFLTFVDRNGRLPLRCAKGFRGPI